MKRKKFEKDLEFVGPKEPREESQIFADLSALCTSSGFAHAIAYFCMRDNFVRFSDKLGPDDLGQIRTGNELIRTEISTLIGLLVKHPIDLTLPSADTMQEFIDRAESLLDELHHALASIWFKGFDIEKVKAGEFDPFSSGASLREPIFYGGDSAYDFQYREFAEKKYVQDEQWLLANRGFSIATALTVSDILGEILTEKQNALPQILKTKPLAEWTALPAVSFSLDEIVTRSGIDVSLVKRVVAAFCLPETDRNERFTALQEYNAANAMPILSVGKDNFILFQHYSLLEAIYESPFYWMAADRDYAATALSHRGNFTEDLAADRLRRVFGRSVRANVVLNRSKGKRAGEIDVLVVFGDRAVVLQAKSKRLSIEARKGNDAQVKSDFKRSVQDAYDQALQCAKGLVEGGYTLIDENGDEIKLPAEVKEIFPVCVVSDHYPALAFQARQFLKIETTEAIRSPLVIDVFALDAMTEMLDTPLRLLSYLMIRSKFSDRLITTHEFTLLSMHLKHNLWVNNKYDLVVLEDDISVYLDVAMIVRRKGVPGTRMPDGALSRMEGTSVGHIVGEIESRADPATIPLGFLLLSLSWESLDTLNKGIGLIVREAAADGRNHDFTILFGETSSGITIHCNDRPSAEAAGSLLNHCQLRKYAEKAQLWFGLILSPDTQRLRFGATLNSEWQQNDELDAATRQMRPALSPADLRRTLRARKKVGRNQPCPCGSGRKYKRCCGLKS